MAAAASHSGVNSAAIDPNNLLLFSVDLDGLTVTEGLATYGHPDDPLIPVGEFTRLLELDVDVRPGEGRIIGHLGEARRALLVDLAAHAARIGPRDVPFTDDDIAVSPTEIYLRSSLVAMLLPLKIAVDGSQLTIGLTATEKLPVQARLARLGNRPQSDETSNEPDEVLIVPAPYQLFSPPGFDVTLNAGARATSPSFPAGYQVRVGGDVLYADLQAYVASDERGKPASATVLLQRKSIEGRLFGPLHGREVDLGDVFTPGLPLGARSVSGRGVTFSTAPIAQTSIFNRIDIRGDLPSGYDVELYVNDVLRGSTNQAANGRYEFLSVPLTPGVNVIRTVTYGPRGERKEETQVINVGAGLLHRGETTFDFGLVDQERPVFRLNSPAQDAGQDVSNARGLRMVGAFNYGMTEFLTLSGGAAITPAANGSGRQVYTAGARTSLFGLATQLDLAADGRGGTGAALGLAGQYDGVSAVLRQAEYMNGFQDENNLGSDTTRELRRRTELTFDTNLKLRGRILPISLRGVRNGYLDGSYDLTGAARVSSSIANVLFSTGLEYGRAAYRGSAPSDTLTGYLTASTYAAYRWQIRATFDYDLLPNASARSLSLSIDRRMSDLWALRLAIGQPLDDLSATDVVLSSIFSTRYGDLSLTGEYDNSRRDWRVGAQWDFGLGYNPLDHKYELTRAGPGAGGSVILDAYMDENGNGVRDPGEPPAPGVVVQGGPSQNQMITGTNGTVFVSGIGAGPTARLNVDLDKLDITSMKSPPTAIQLAPRPGSVTHVNYPLRPTGDVMVKLDLVRDDGKHVGLSAVRVQLVPTKGAPVEVTTEFDGSALFSGLPVGSYKLQLDPAQAQQLRMHLTTHPTMEIKGDGSFTPDVAAEVQFDPAANTPPAEASAN